MDGKNSRLDSDTSRAGVLGFVDWLNEKVYRVAGPPPLGPYDPIVERVGEATCPVCGQAMAEHTIDHSSPSTILNCPVEHLPAPVREGPLNELGMPKGQAPRQEP